MRKCIIYSSTLDGSVGAVGGKFRANTLFAFWGLQSVREPLRMLAIMVLSMAVVASIFGYATPINLTLKAMIADRDDVFSGRLISGVTREHLSGPPAKTPLPSSANGKCRSLVLATLKT